MALLTEIASEQWLNVYNSSTVSGKLQTAHLQDNIFSSLQWTGIEVITQTRRKYWALDLDNQLVSFLHSYFLSQNVMRLRGLCTLPSHQNQGYMKSLLELVIDQYKKPGLDFLCFASSSGIPVCESAGFTIVKNFTPRYVEYKNLKTQEWLADKSSLIFMMKRTSL